MTPINPNILQYLTIDQILNHHPLTVPPDMAIDEVVDQMGQLSAERCRLSQGTTELFHTSATPKRRSCALVLEQSRILGIFTERDLVRLGAALSDVFQRLHQGKVRNQNENSWLAKSGDRKLINWSNTVLTDEAGRVEYVIGTGIDITEQRRTEQTLAQQYQQQQLLAEVTRNIRDWLDLDQILETAATGVQALLGCDRVLIIRIESDTVGRVIQEAMNVQHPGPSLLHEVFN